MSKESMGSAPVTAKYDEHPMCLQGVTLSAQNTEYTPNDHRFWSLTMALNSDWQTSKWEHSTVLLARELYLLIHI
jgi:hypothetical protein